MYPRRTITKPFEGRIKPFKITENTYFVGTYQASSHIIDTGDGLIMIDTGYTNALYLVIESLWELGFEPGNIKYIVNTHWHDDHTAGTEAMAHLSCAKTLIGEFDAPVVAKKGLFSPDISIKDGDILSCGNTEIRFMHTPGHTEGTISFFFNTQENGKTYRAGMFGGAGANTLVPNRLNFYPECRNDYLNSVERLMKEKVDVFLGNHCWNNNTEIKAKQLENGEENPFIDANQWINFLNYCKKRCLSLPPLKSCEKKD